MQYSRIINHHKTPEDIDNINFFTIDSFYYKNAYKKLKFNSCYGVNN